MTNEIISKIIEICNQKIKQKGENLGLSFNAFLKNKNDNPELLMQVAEGCIRKHKPDYFEKAVKIRVLVEK